MAILMGLDIGTSSISGVLFDSVKQVVVETESRFNNAGVSGLPEGYHEQCPVQLWVLVQETIQEFVQRTIEPIAGIALTGQMHGILAVDETLKPVTNLITWQDQRTSQSPIVFREHGYAERTGCFLHPGYGGLTLSHLIHTETLPQDTFRVLSAPGYIAAKLTGICGIDETFAASWGIWDILSNTWNTELLEQLNISFPGLLPDFYPSCIAMGEVTNNEISGLNATVYSPVGDNQAGVAGVLNSPKEAVVNIGTSSQLSVPLTEYSFTPRLETRPGPGGQFLQTYAALCGGWSYMYLAHFFQKVIRDLGGVDTDIPGLLTSMDHLCSSTDAEGLKVDVRFAGERHGSCRFGSISGINAENFIPSNLIRGFVNGIVSELAEASSWVDRSSLQGIAAVGNASHKNPLLKKAIEEQFGLPCRIAGTGEEAAVGAVKLVLSAKWGDR